MKDEELIDKIQQLSAFSEQEKSQLVSLLRHRKKYGLIWEDKPEDLEKLLLSQLPVLEELSERKILAKNLPAQPDLDLFPKDDPLTPNHVLIEGDNLHALTTLAFTHEGKIDLIYIDPPYNTGNKDFKYNDRFVDKEDSFRHSQWLSFMHKRLRIAKRLLSEKGVIFISIDDNEQAQVKLLCDQIFGEDNFVGKWDWFKSATPPNLSYKIKKNLEYILGYEKIRNNTKYTGIQKVSKSDDPMTKPQNTIKTLKFEPNTIYFNNPNNFFAKGIYGTTKFPNELLDDLIIENGKNKNAVSFSNRFVWTQEKLDAELENGTIMKASENLVLSYKKKEYSPEVPPNLIDSSVGVETTEQAGRDLFDIFEKKVFDYPKPVSLIKYLINFINQKEIKILDFFAGSGTTLHAVMQLNAEDGGNRQCILVTNNENKICEEVTYVRNKRVIEGYTNAKGERMKGLIHNNLHYYRCTFVESLPTETNRRLLTDRSTELLQIKEDCYTEITEKEGFVPAEARFFTNDLGKYLLIVYYQRDRSALFEQIKAWIEALKPSKKIRFYAFSPTSEAIYEEFWEVEDYISVVPLPEVIYNAYKATFRDLKLEKYENQDANT